jgi:hypothetical protein
MSAKRRTMALVVSTSSTYRTLPTILRFRTTMNPENVRGPVQGDGSPSAAIKNGINFLLDFDFQSLYTIINCGFLLRPHSMNNGKGRIATWQQRKRAERRRAARKSNCSSAL